MSIRRADYAALMTINASSSGSVVTATNARTDDSG